MEFKATKGELTLHEKPYANSNGFYVQSVSSEFDNNMLFANAYGHTKEEAEANAKLIACAPEMFEALKEMIAFTEFHGYTSSTEINNARSIILKATTI